MARYIGAPKWFRAGRSATNAVCARNRRTRSMIRPKMSHGDFRGPQWPPDGCGMTLRITNLETPVDVPEAELPRRIARALGVRPEGIARWRILRKSWTPVRAPA